MKLKYAKEFDIDTDELNQKLTEWLGLCWHDFQISHSDFECIMSYCSKCGLPDYDYSYELREYTPINRNLDFKYSLDLCYEKLALKLFEGKLDIELFSDTDNCYFCHIHKQGRSFEAPVAYYPFLEEKPAMAVSKTVWEYVKKERMV